MNNSIKYIIAFFFTFLFIAIFSFDLFSSIGIGLFLFFGVKFFLEIGEKIEIRDIMILIAVLQWIIGPLLAYKVYPDDDFYYMAVEIDVYMSFVVPASFAFVLGLYLPLKNQQEGESLYLFGIKNTLKKYKNLDLLLVLSGVILNIFVLSFPQSIRFAASLLSDVRFVGLYLLLLGHRKNKWLIVGGVILMLLLTALRNAMFHDLILWLSFFLMIAAFVYKPTVRKKAIFVISLLFLVITLQTIKHSFREALSEGTGEGVSLFADLVQEEVFDSDYATSESNLSAMVTRINQGWIIARIMSWTPSHEPFAGGETIMEAIKSSFMPRFLFPNKVTAGGRTYFTRFTGKDISDQTSMGLGLVGEAYANYGINGGAFFMFIIGFFYNFFLSRIYKIAKKHPAIIFFIPLLFLQVVKAETDFSVILNHLMKATVVVWAIFFGLRKFLKIKI